MFFNKGPAKENTRKSLCDLRQRWHDDENDDRLVLEQRYTEIENRIGPGKDISLERANVLLAIEVLLKKEFSRTLRKWQVIYGGSLRKFYESMHDLLANILKTIAEFKTGSTNIIHVIRKCNDLIDGFKTNELVVAVLNKNISEHSINNIEKAVKLLGILQECHQINFYDDFHLKFPIAVAKFGQEHASASSEQQNALTKIDRLFPSLIASEKQDLLKYLEESDLPAVTKTNSVHRQLIIRNWVSATHMNQQQAACFENSEIVQAMADVFYRDLRQQLGKNVEQFNLPVIPVHVMNTITKAFANNIFTLDFRLDLLLSNADFQTPIEKLIALTSTAEYLATGSVHSNLDYSVVFRTITKLADWTKKHPVDIPHNDSDTNSDTALLLLICDNLIEGIKKYLNYDDYAHDVNFNLAGAQQALCSIAANQKFPAQFLPILFSIFVELITHPRTKHDHRLAADGLVNIAHRSEPKEVREQFRRLLLVLLPQRDKPEQQRMRERLMTAMVLKQLDNKRDNARPDTFNLFSFSHRQQNLGNIINAYLGGTTQPNHIEELLLNYINRAFVPQHAAVEPTASAADDSPAPTSTCNLQ